MNGLVNWVLSAIGHMCPQAFATHMGMTVEQASAAIARGDTAVRQKVQAFFAKMQKEQPEVCQQAAGWGQNNFPGQVASEKPNQQPNK